MPPANLPFLFAAFAVAWIAFFAYAFFVSRRQQELRKEIAELRGALDQQVSEDVG
jgi:CcmD family protein